MKWKSPQAGDIKLLTKFAFLPITIGHETRWFEWVTIKQVCKEIPIPPIHPTLYWEDTEFIEDTPEENITNG